MPSRLENRIYLAAFALIGLIALMMTSYLSGCAQHEAGRIHAIDAAVSDERIHTDEQQRQAEYWRSKYVALTHEVDAVTVMSAEVAFEQERAAP